MSHPELWQTFTKLEVQEASPTGADRPSEPDRTAGAGSAKIGDDSYQHKNERVPGDFYEVKKVKRA